MKHPKESPIKNHYLQSILPHPTYPVPKQFAKTKQFYKPQKFIWNNPHRTSQQLYKFYHAYNDNYTQNREPLIRQLQQKDREEQQMKRIHRLIAFRNKVREEFIGKQKSRELIQTRTRDNQSLKCMKVEDNFLPFQSKYKSHSSTKIKKINVLDDKQRSQRLMRIQDTYKKSVNNFEAKTEEISNLIHEQNQEYHRKIRSQFIARKKVNDSTNNKFYQKKSKVAQTIQ